MLHPSFKNVKIDEITFQSEKTLSTLYDWEFRKKGTFLEPSSILF